MTRRTKHTLERQLQEKVGVNHSQIYSKTSSLESQLRQERRMGGAGNRRGLKGSILIGECTCLLENRWGLDCGFKKGKHFLPTDRPQWEPQRFMLLSEMAAMRSWSYARVKKVARPLANTMFRSRAAQPVATLTYERWILFIVF